MKQGEIKLANKAFSRGQQADTGFVNAWVGQAIIAERIGQSDEAMDLFRHCTQLEFRTESAVGYAYWVCNILSNPENLKDPRYKYAIENMHAVPVALDSINWYDMFTLANIFRHKCRCLQVLWCSRCGRNFRITIIFRIPELSSIINE